MYCVLSLLRESSIVRFVSGDQCNTPVLQIKELACKTITIPRYVVATQAFLQLPGNGQFPGSSASYCQQCTILQQRISVTTLAPQLELAGNSEQSSNSCFQVAKFNRASAVTYLYILETEFGRLLCLPS